MTRVWIIGPLIIVLYSYVARWLVPLPWVLLYKVRSEGVCWALPMEHEIVLWVRSVFNISVCLQYFSSSSVDHVWLSLASARQSHSRAHAIDCHGSYSLSHKEELPSSCNDNYSYEKSGFWNHSCCPVYWWSLVSVGHFSATLKWLKI